MVQDGKLTAEEALTVLEQLDGAEKYQQAKETEAIQELSTIVHGEKEHSQQSYGKKVNSAKDKLMDFVDGLVQKIKDVDLDFNFGQSVEIDHIFHYEGAHINNIEIEIANGETEIIPSESDDIRIECTAKVYRVEDVTEARKHLLEDARFSVSDGKMRFVVQSRSIKVKAIVYVPQTKYDEIKVKQFNGMIKGSDLQAVLLKAKTANGKISFDKVDISAAELETVNGAVRVTDSYMRELETETVNGSIHVEGEFVKTDVQTINGRIHCQLKGQGGEEIKAKSAAGSIEILLPSHIQTEGELKSNLGGFMVDLDGIQVVEEKTEVVQKFLRFRTKETQDRVVRIQADTKTGSVTVKKSAEL